MTIHHKIRDFDRTKKLLSYYIGIMTCPVIAFDIITDPVFTSRLYMIYELGDQISNHGNFNDLNFGQVFP